MKRISRRAKYPTAEQLQERAAWADQFDSCWVCRSTKNLQTHEIARRSQAAGKWADVRNYVRTCGRCHDEILDWISVRWQLALKRLHDFDNYDRQFVNRIRSEAPDSIAEYEVKLRVKLWEVIREPYKGEGRH